MEVFWWHGHWELLSAEVNLGGTAFEQGLQLKFGMNTQIAAIFISLSIMYQFNGSRCKLLNHAGV